MASKKKKINYKKIAFRVGLCLVGSLLLAIGTGVFLTPGNVVAGGVSGIGIIINHYIEPLVKMNVVDIVVWILNIIFLILSIIFLGKRFTIQTLVATFVFPAFLSLIQRTGMFNFIIDELKASNNNILLAGIFGGLFVGAGVAITFLGDGSTGGTDVLCFIVAKYTPIKQSVSSFASDALVIIAGMACIRNQIVASLVGILSALLCALMIQVIFVSANTIYIADIVTTKYRELSNYIIKELDGTCTLIDAKGAYKSEQDIKILRIVVDKRDFVRIKDQVAVVDEKAFVTITNAKKVLGEGFTALYKRRERLVEKKNDR